MASRSTFRDPAGSVAWQRQLRDRYAAEGVPPVPHLDVARSVVRPVSRALAEQIVKQYEWLGTMASTSRHFGIFFGAWCAGVTCVGVGTGSPGSNTHKTFGLAPRELAVLARGACVHWAPPGTNSRLVSWTCRLLARDCAAKLLIAYADTDAGEIGTIYQACGWAYVGRADAARQIVAPNGRIYDERSFHERSRRRRMDKGQYVRLAQQHGWRVQHANRKHRYVCVLDRSDRTLVGRVESMRQSYPKRPPRLESEAPGIPAGHEGAAMPPAGSATSEATDAA